MRVKYPKPPQIYFAEVLAIMTPVLTYLDFANGRFFIALNERSRSALEAEISYQQNRVFPMVMTDVFYDEYNTNPAATKWNKVRELGLHEMLKNFVYLNFRKTSIYSTSVGNKTNDAETSTNSDNAQLRQQLEFYGNSGADIYNNIVQYMTNNIDFVGYKNDLLPIKTL